MRWLCDRTHGTASRSQDASARTDLASAPLLPKFVSEGAAMYHELRKRGTSSGSRYVGRPMPRFEDRRLMRGAGRYTDDVPVEGQSYAVFVRSPHAHADIISINTAAA